MKQTVWRYSLLMLCLMACGAAWAEDAPSRPYPGGQAADLWLLAGQSNMLGSASLPDQLEPPNPRIQLFNMDNTWIVAQDPLHRIFEAEAPIIAWFRYNDGVTTEQYQKLRMQSRERPLGGVGPGMSFARTVAAAVDRPLGLIANSPGGSGMKHWDPALKDKHGDSLYGAMLDRVRMVGGNIKGLLWYQGEGETMENDAAGKYEAALENLFNSVRRDTGIPNLPILMVQISRWTKANDPELDRKWEMVRDVQYRMARKMEHVELVSAIDLTLTDEIHLDLAAQRRLGKRLGEVALSKVYGVPGHGRPIVVESISAKNLEPKQNLIRVKFSGVTGKLKAEGRPTGFSVRFPGQEKMTPDVYKVEFDPAEPSVVLLHLGLVTGNKAQLIYGAGANPYVNITDERDMPIPAFGPVEFTIDGISQ